MKYFFRDKDAASNLENGMDFHAAGIIVDDIAEPFIRSASGKDVAVKFLHPFTGTVECCWRAFDEIEIFPADDESKLIDYNDVADLFKTIG